jgi:hypothetical protein
MLIATESRILCLRRSAGLGAGLTEAIFAVTPSETIKLLPYNLLITVHAEFSAKD